MNLRRWSLGVKIGTGFAVLILVFLLVGGVMLYGVTGSGGASKFFTALESQNREVYAAAREVAEGFRTPHAGLISRLQSVMDRQNLYVGKLASSVEQEAGAIHTYRVLLRNALKQATSVLMACEREPSFGESEERRAIGMSIIKGASPTEEVRPA